MNKKSELELLKSLKKDNQETLRQTRVDKDEAQRKINTIEITLAKLNKQIKDIEDQQQPVKISDHAYIRYFTRVMGLNLEAIEKEILEFQGVEDQIQMVGNGKYPGPNNCTLVVRDRTIVTILSKDEQ